IKRKLREGEHEVHETLDHIVDRAPQIARGYAYQGADRRGDRHHGEGDEKRNARTVDASREDVAAELVRAEQVDRPPVGGTEEVSVRRDDAEETVLVAFAEEAQRRRIIEYWAGERLKGDGAELARLADRIDVRDQAEAAVGRGERDHIGWREGRIRRPRVHRSEEVRENGHDDEKRHQHQ